MRGWRAGGLTRGKTLQRRGLRIRKFTKKTPRTIDVSGVFLCALIRDLFDGEESGEARHVEDFPDLWLDADEFHRALLG